MAYRDRMRSRLRPSHHTGAVGLNRTCPIVRGDRHDALQQLAPYLDHETNLRIPRQRTVDRLPDPQQLTACPPWCASHTSSSPMLHRSHVLEADFIGVASYRGPIEINTEAKQTPEDHWRTPNQM